MAELDLGINKNPWMDADYNTCALTSKLGVVSVGISSATELAETAEKETKTPTTGAVSSTCVMSYLNLTDTFDTTYVKKKGFIPIVNDAETGLVLGKNWPFPSGGDLYEPLFCDGHKLQWGWKPEESMFVGFDAGISITEGTGNTLGGYRSGYKLTVEKGNTFYGNRSGYLVGDIEGTEETIETSSYDVKYSETSANFQKYMPLCYWDGMLVSLDAWVTATGVHNIIGSTDGVTWSTLKSMTSDYGNGGIPSVMASYKGSIWFSIYYNTTSGVVQQWDGSILTGHHTSPPGGNYNIDHLYVWDGKLWAIHDVTPYGAGNSSRLISWTTGSTSWTTITDYDGVASYNYNTTSSPSQYWGQKVNHLFAFENSLYWLCSRYNSTTTKWEGKILKWDGTSAFDVVATIAPTDTYLHVTGAVNVSGTVYLFMSEFGDNGALSATDYKLVVYVSTDMLTWTLWKDFGDIGLVCDLVYFNQRVFVNVLNPSDNYTEIYYLGIGDRSLTKEVSITADAVNNSGTFAQLGGYLYVGKNKGIYRRTASTWIQAIEPDDTFGSYNTFIGYGVGITNLTGRFNTLLGTLSDVANPELENATAIGYRAIVGDSNTLVLGGTGAYAVNVCIGKTGGSERLDISGNIKTSGQFISGQATGTSPMSVQSTTVNANFNSDLLDGNHASAFASIDHSLLSATHGDTTAAAVQRGDLITGQSATPIWTRLAKGTSGYFLKSDASDVAWAAHGLTYSDVGAEASGAVATHAALITGVHGLVFTAGKTLTLTESLTLNALPVGGLAVATSANTLGSLAVGLTTQILVGGGAATVPVWTTDLPTAVTIGTAYIHRVGGTDVAVADGGTNKSSWTLYAIPYASGTTTIGEIAIGTAGQALVVNGGANGYTWTTALSNPMTDIGDMIIGGAAGAPAKLPDVAVGSYMRSGGVVTAPLWSTLILPNAATAYRLPVATAANTIGELVAVGATGEYLKGNTGAIPSWATLNQAAVDGLKTTDGPTFDHLHITGVNGVYVGDGTSKTWFGNDGGINYIESGNNAWNASALLKFTGYATNAGTFEFNGDIASTTVTTTGIIKAGDAAGFSGKRGFSIADDNVYSFTPTFNIGMFCMTGYLAQQSCILYYYIGVHLTSLASGSSVNVTTGILTGTTGTDGKITVSEHSDGKIYIENRTGGLLYLSFMIMAGY